jgi:hypothetical protein
MILSNLNKSMRPPKVNNQFLQDVIIEYDNLKEKVPDNLLKFVDNARNIISQEMYKLKFEPSGNIDADKSTIDSLIKIYSTVELKVIEYSQIISQFKILYETTKKKPDLALLNSGKLTSEINSLIEQREKLNILIKHKKILLNLEEKIGKDYQEFITGKKDKRDVESYITYLDNLYNEELKVSPRLSAYLKREINLFINKIEDTKNKLKKFMSEKQEYDKFNEEKNMFNNTSNPNTSHAYHRNFNQNFMLPPNSFSNIHLHNAYEHLTNREYLNHNAELEKAMNYLRSFKVNSERDVEEAKSFLSFINSNEQIKYELTNTNDEFKFINDKIASEIKLYG